MVLASSMARSTSVFVMFDVVIVSGPMLFPGMGVLTEFGLERSLINFGLPRPNVLLFVVVSSMSSGVFGLFVSNDGASDSMSGSIIIVRLCLDGDLINRPSDPGGPIPLLLCSWFKSAMGLLISFLCVILPLGVVTVWSVPDIANCGLTKYALSNLFRWFFSSEKKKGSYLLLLNFSSASWAADQTHRQLH